MTDKDDGTMPALRSATSAAASGCPVLARGGGPESSTAKPGLWNRWFSRSTNNDNAPSSSSSSAQASSMSECPVKGIDKYPPASIEEAANHSQIPAPGQRIPLSTQRVISSIPRGDDDTDNNAPIDNNNTIANSNSANKPSVPAHQPADSPRWQYPSEQQFYNAMLRKGYRPPVESIPSVLRIHNAVNERSWTQLRRWESEVHGNDDPKLVRFVGRPKDLSPRAWWNSRVLMTQEPFDRHDWYVEDAAGGGDRGMSGGKAIVKPPSMYIDVRPALDNPSAAVDRMTMFMREALPGISSAWDSHKASSSASMPVAEMEGSKNKNGSGKQ
eukprot:CAMPEP_0181108862 /NCGR_PEP_ID=MMETSP1071-20121207/17860_1 /TAXON_ID=35127 /ORGANISM="Thalassiosira sp., Strain NH16" /LENGTH=327 /DNA_ID=CAMNT_0023192501 /DNA_START=32 /DNA_END=1016 /DNA_ORIENTATION=+